MIETDVVAIDEGDVVVEISDISRLHQADSGLFRSSAPKASTRSTRFFSEKLSNCSDVADERPTQHKGKWATANYPVYV